MFFVIEPKYRVRVLIERLSVTVLPFLVVIVVQRALSFIYEGQTARTGSQQRSFVYCFNDNGIALHS